jgi:RNA polymerase sigma factor (sigma-70 family)
MKLEIEFKGFESNANRSARIRALIETLLDRVAKRAKAFRPDALFARVVVEQNPPHNLSRVSVKVDLPEKVLASKKETRDLEAGLRAAFEEIERQLEAHKATLRGEGKWKQLERREEIREKRSTTPSSELPETFYAIVQPYLRRLRRFVTDAIGFLTAKGDLPAGEVTSEDIVDAVIVEAYEQYTLDPTPGNIQAWLIRLATKQLARHVARFKKELPGAIESEEGSPELRSEPDESVLSDALLDIYHPDEDINLQDLLPNVVVASPEKDLEQKELRQCVRSAFDSMPAEQRRLLLLHYVQDVSIKRLAKMIRRTEHEVKEILDHARNHLRRELKQSGCVIADDAGEDARSEAEVAARKLAG